MLFELSSCDRMKLLLRLQQQKMKLSHISEKLNMTLTETSRHVQRLSEAKLIQKDVDGLYGLTAFGTLAISLLSGIGFASRNVQYFLEHDLSTLPVEFIERLGELSAVSTATSDPMTTFRRSELLVQNAGEYIWILSDVVLTSIVPTIREQEKKGVKFRFIFQEGAVLPPGVTITQTPGVKREPNNYKQQLTAQQIVLAPKVYEHIVMTEKEAQFGFRELSGKMDYSLLVSSDLNSHKWCRDLFLYRWEKAVSVLSK